MVTLRTKFRHADRDEKRRMTLELKLKGLTYREVGDALGISRQRVQQITSPPPEIAAAVIRRAVGRCERCAIQTEHGHIHHSAECCSSVAWHDSLVNLEYLCISCHMKAHWAEVYDYKPDGRIKKEIESGG